jgi:hypothetical protein
MERHQVFISSTFTDLAQERREVIEALLEMDAFPAGMELFAAGNTDQWTLIQQVIDQSDYYIVIVGGRYGSTTAEGISYTEMEYDYAVQQGIPVMGFVHANPDAIAAGKTELDPGARKKLDAFREKVKQKIVRHYATSAELGGAVSRGLHKLQREFPRPGWVRGDLAMTPETEARIAELRAEVAELRQAAAERKVESSGTLHKIEGLAFGDDTYDLQIKVNGTSQSDVDEPSYLRKTYVWTLKYQTTWNSIVELVGPPLMDEASEREISDTLDGLGASLIRSQPEKWPSNIDEVRTRSVSTESVNDVLVQLFALGLITHGAKRRTSSDQNRYWVLTNSGQDQLMRLRAIRRPSTETIAASRRVELASFTVPKLQKLARDKHRLDGKGRKEELISAILAAEAQLTP